MFVTYYATPLSFLFLLPVSVFAEPTLESVPFTSTKEASAKQDGKLATVEVKGMGSDYDPRRDDTASKTVINADEIRKFGDDNIYDVLKRAPGITVTGKTLRMRGLGDGYTQILVNGDQPPPGFSLDNLSPNQIERIEIVHAASAEFSMQAIAGSVNIVLKKITAKAQRDLRLSYSRSSVSESYNLGGTFADKVGSLSWFLDPFLFSGTNSNLSTGIASLILPSQTVMQLRSSRSEGHGSYRGGGLFPRLSYKLENGDELNFSGAVQTSYNGWDNRTHYNNQIGTFSNPDYVDLNSRGPNRLSMQQGELGWIAKIAGGKLDFKVSAERSRTSNQEFSESLTAGNSQRLLRDWDTSERGRRISLSSKYTRSLFDDHALSAGLESSVQNSEQFRDRRDQLNQNAPARLVETFAPKVTHLAGYTQDEWSINKHFSVYLGARWEGIRTDSEADSGPTGRFLTSSRNHVLSPVAQTLYKFPDGSGRQLRMALTRTYKAPTVEQLTTRRYEAPVNTRFAPDSSGNPDLRPELAKGIDLIYEHFLQDDAMFSVSVSRRAISNTIRTLLTVENDGRWVYYPLNDGDALVRSLQLEGKAPGKRLATALERFDFRASISRNWSTVASVPGPSNRLDGQIPMSATAGIDYRAGALTSGTNFSWQKGGWVRVSEAQSYYQLNRRELDAYILYRFSPHYQLRVSAKNLLEQDNGTLRIYQDAQGSSRETSFNRGFIQVAANIEMKF